jgi:hypothetical protein
MIWALLAPGPSASVELAERLRGMKLGVVGCAFQLAPWAEVIAASDKGWWAKYPEAMRIPRRYAMHRVEDVVQLQLPQIAQTTNSGVLALEAAKLQGATRILLFGFDMQGTHFFGPYVNGLRNTKPHQRRNHLNEYQAWRSLNRKIEVVNCTPGSALTCFPMMAPDEVLPEPATTRAA